MTLALDTLAEPAVVAPKANGKAAAKRRIRALAKIDSKLHRFQRRLLRGKLKHTRSVQWNVLVSLVHRSLELCRIAHRDGSETGAHRMLEAMWWNSAPRWDGNCPEARDRMVYFIETAIDTDVLPTEISEWPDIAVLALYPRASAHLICGSLGYATADRAARMIAAAHDGKRASNEWAYDYALRSYAKEVETGRMCQLNTGHESACDFDAQWTLDPARITECCFGRCHTKERVKNTTPWAIHEAQATKKLVKACLESTTWSPRRRRHSGYMAHYPNARMIVLRELLNLTPHGTLAAWF